MLIEAIKSIVSKRWITSKTDLLISMRYLSSKTDSSSGKPPYEENMSNIPKPSTVDHQDVTFHAKLRDQWWDTRGVMGMLHSMNKLRVPFIRDGLICTNPTLDMNKETAIPLHGIKLLEVGCGGGILTEPLSRLGASVLGLDASDQLIALAKYHCEESQLDNLKYVHSSIEEFSDHHLEEFDGIVASEIIEHVNDKDLFIRSCVKTLKPGGSIFLTTFNKTNMSWLGGILIAENVLGIIPKGTHQWEKFISPSDMSRLLEKYGCKTKLVHGMFLFILNNEWYWTSNTVMNYAIHAVKTV